MTDTKLIAPKRRGRPKLPENEGTIRLRIYLTPDRLEFVKTLDPSLSRAIVRLIDNTRNAIDAEKPP